MPGENRIRLPREKPHYSREQKAALGIIICFGTFALIFGGFYLWNHIASPFALSYTGPRFLTGDEKQAEEVRKAKQADTDGDTVNDYDELYIYKTSPYLADSDSDGMNDGTEITSGGDPNCAVGAACDTAEQETEDLEGSFLDEAADTYRDAAEATPQERTLSQTLGSLTPDQIRKLLIDSGGNAAEIEALSDEDLMNLVNQAMEEIEAEQAEEPTEPATTSPPVTTGEEQTEPTVQ